MSGISRWLEAEADPASVHALTDHLGWPEPLARALVRRGVTRVDQADAWLHPRLSAFPDPADMSGMLPGAERIWQAILNQETIVVYGDYDVDGITSTALMVRVLKELGADVHSFLPHRVEDGYGLSMDPVRHCIDTLGAQLIVTVDCGTGSQLEIEAAGEAGVDVIVSDHHTPTGEPAQPLALINPRTTDLTEWHVLAGVGVAFMLCFALIQTGRRQKQASALRVDLKYFLDLVAVGTVADIVPLQGMNRAFVRSGLKQLASSRVLGLQALLKVAKIEPPLEAQHIGFGLGPRLNAAGRLGTAETALQLLLTEDAAEAFTLAESLHAANAERRKVEKMILEAAELFLAESAEEMPWILVADGEGWHPGVIGIVASRLVRSRHRPSVVIAIDENGVGKGSCRSIEALNIVRVLEACKEELIKFGGHHMAAGFEIAADRIPCFRRRLNEEAGRVLQTGDLDPVLTHDGEMELGRVDLDLMKTLDLMRPFGAENPEPSWLYRDVQVLSSRVVGGSHLKLQVGTGARSWSAIAFGLGELHELEGRIDFVGTPFVNRFRGRESVEFRIRELQNSPPG